jgi:hypothetical protein
MSSASSFTPSVAHQVRLFMRVLVVVVGVFVLLTLGSRPAKALDPAPVTGTVSDTTDTLTDTVTDTTDPVIDTVTDTTDTVIDTVTDTTDAVTGTVSDTTGTIDDLTGTVDGTMTGTVDTMTGTVDETVNDVTDTVGDLTGTTGEVPTDGSVVPPLEGTSGTTTDPGTTDPEGPPGTRINPAAPRNATEGDVLSVSTLPTNVPNGSAPIPGGDASAPSGGTTETAGHGLPFNAGLLGLALLLALAFGRWLRLSADTRAPDPFASPIEVPG